MSFKPEGVLENNLTKSLFSVKSSSYLLKQAKIQMQNSKNHRAKVFRCLA